MKPIHIFKPGTHQDSISGKQIAFSEADVAASIAAYDPKLHEAPITIGHPKSDRPAYGWVAGLSAASEGGMDAKPHQLDATFEEGVRGGKYKKVSAAFYAPDSPVNPKPGVWYLRHVAFLGAQPPAVKGLRAVEFAEAEDGVVSVEFGEADGWLWSTVGRLFRRLRDQLVADKGLEEADKLLPEWDIQSLTDAAATERASRSPAFSEPEPQDMNAQQLAEREAALAAREQAQQQRDAQFAEREQRIATIEAEHGRAEAVAFAESLIAGGQVLPRDKDGLVAVLTARSIGDSVAFGEGDDHYEGAASEWLRGFLKRLPKQVEFSEFAGADKGMPKTPKGFRGPAGAAVSPHSAALHERAVAFQEANPGTDYLAAVQAVENAG